MDLELIKNKLRYPQKYGQATPEEAKFAFDNGYMGGPKTQEYYSDLGLLDPPAESQPQSQPQEPNLEFTNNPTGAQNVEFKRSPLDMWSPFGAQQDPNIGLQNKIQAASTNGAIDPTKMSDQLAADQRRQELDTQTAQQVQADKEAFDAKQAKRQARRQDFRDSTSDISNTLSAWTPVGIAALGGIDRSGEAAGYAAQAAQNQYNAAQNEKLRQQNMQQAMDNTIAEKMAAAESDTGAKQVARELGPEAGAQGAAAEAASKIATPDLWKQKQLQNERRDVAAQNLAEVNRNKLMAIGNETNESMTNYATNVEDSQNAYKAALANANGKAEAKTEDKPKENTEEKKEETPTTPSGSTTSTETNESQPTDITSTAPSNQESEGVESATNQVAIEDIIKQAEELNNKIKAGNAEPGMIDTYNELKSKYEELKTKVENPPAFPDMWMPSNNNTDVSSIASAVDDLTL